ncbi:uncharacterized protein F5147DRAFT_690910 [Suillus discolor]|uniref:Uncharacterized protein n=1 Tax=Suillus discolor TaxID=1912936 RepID=A0A9P7FAC0_9AGAM|nr:uncharacterized protein F5147DRAFT_690910 [Suillus discolor]KAG2109931.1 hypothetical protein F5147DRAFT_690910 [Suillus discolor]
MMTLTAALTRACIQLIALTNIALLINRKAQKVQKQKAQEKRGSSRLVAAEIGQCTGTVSLALEIPLHRRTKSIHTSILHAQLSTSGDTSSTFPSVRYHFPLSFSN